MSNIMTTNTTNTHTTTTMNPAAMSLQTDSLEEGSGGDAEVVTRPQHELPSSWSTHYSRTNMRWYFFNENTGDKQWEPPDGATLQGAMPAEPAVVAFTPLRTKRGAEGDGSSSEVTPPSASSSVSSVSSASSASSAPSASSAASSDSSASPGEVVCRVGGRGGVGGGGSSSSSSSGGAGGGSGEDTDDNVYDPMAPVAPVAPSLEDAASSAGSGGGGGGKRRRAVRMLSPPVIKRNHPQDRRQMWYREDLQPSPMIQSIFREGKVETGDGAMIKFTSGVNPEEGMHIYNVVKDNRFKRTLEVGLANGTSALYILQAMEDNGLSVHDSAHIALDPNQHTQWKSVGELNVGRAGLDKRFTLMLEPSYLAMPTLLRQVREGRAEKFDMIFIDGMHLFDYTLMDFFYADLLLNVNGVILLDDIRHRGVNKCYRYLQSNFKHFELVSATPASSTMATFVKTGEDPRDWDFHAEF
jgi:predicted O-methyltransferase YrrM